MRRLLAALLLLASACTAGRATNIKGCNGTLLPLYAISGDRSAATHTAVLLMTGDGGWRSIDRGIASVMQRNGIPVYGFLSNRYFATLRTKEEALCDLRRSIDLARRETGVADVVLVGFSRGADTLAFSVPALTAEERAHIALVVLLAPAETASLRVERWWRSGPAPFPVAIEPLVSSARTICIYGLKDHDSLCPHLTAPASVIPWRGGHHFDGNYTAIGETIFENIRMSPAPTEGRERSR